MASTIVRPPGGPARLSCTFRTQALGTVAELYVTESSVLVMAAALLQSELARIDRVASRFRTDSELSALNGREGEESPVSADLFEAVEVALAMADATEGLVDPTVGAAMNRLGYDRDFSLVRGGCEGTLPEASVVPGWRSVTLDPGHRTITLPAGTSLDLGATAKALAAERAAVAIHERLGCGVLVSLGGDVASAGDGPPEGFAIGLADTCTSPEISETVAIRSGGLASSGIGARSWRLGAHQVSHIVDPSTGLPAVPYWRTVSVTAATCVQANAASTASVVLGSRAVPWLESLCLPARLVGLDGSVILTRGWPEPSAHSEAGLSEAGRSR